MNLTDQPRDADLLERVRGPSVPMFDASLAILTGSIPQEEQLPMHRWADLLAGDDYRLYAYHLGREVYASALLYLPAGGDFAWLDYMAVRQDMRGRQIGSHLFHKLVSIAKGDRPGAEWFMLEVDDDRDECEEIRQTNRRRIRFYQRLGARLLANVPYRFPSPTGANVPMRLMAAPLRRGVKLSPQYVCRAIETVFCHIHGRASTDPLLVWILNNAPSALSIE